MNAYLYPITTAAWQFPLIALLLTMPYVIYCYRKFGSVSVLRSFILFSMLFYLQCAFYLCILPLPDPATVSASTKPFLNLVPFQNIIDFLEKSSFDVSNPRTWLVAMRESYFLEPMFNLLLLLPFGIYLAYYFKSSLKKVLLFSFLLSLLFELTQLTGLWGVYSRPYRLFDVNDLMLNTLGGVLGYAVFRGFLKFLPSRDSIDAKSVERGRKVSFTRRTVALAFDGVAMLLIVVPVARLTDVNALNTGLVTMFIYFPLFSVILRGSTPGKAIVRIKVAAIGKKPRLLTLTLILRCTLRNAAAPLFLWLASLVSSLAAQYLPVIVELLLLLLLGADFLHSLKKGKRLWYERLTRTQNVSTNKTR
ncbi:MAG: VanZ family protein [Oscillospiraceae bacterium]|jgi:glycopeptide antibiotics resistance protein|nr:VanZ family protein [Oscillospiraceae bacterium]